MIHNLSEIEIVARTLYGEARGEVAKIGPTALEAIASVIWNRWKYNPRRFGKTLKEICLKPYQFSCWNSHDPNLLLLSSVSLDDGVYALCKMVAQESISGKVLDVTNGADHYHSIWIHPPDWALGKTPVADIGNHRFYKLS